MKKSINRIAKLILPMIVAICAIAMFSCTQPEPPHVHTFSWTADSTKHWHVASCGREEHNEDAAEHIWNHEDCQYDSVSGKEIRTCTVCLYVDEFTKTVKVLPAGTDGTAGTSATYVEFGDWPQSVLPSDSTVTVDETKKVIMGANTYYLGSDGNYYAKCKEYAYGNGNEYKYHDGTRAGILGSTTRYFKVEPIKWRVLTDNYSGKKLLLSENILTANVPYYEYIDTRTIEGKTVYPNNYKHSQIRAYLNGLTYQGPSSEVTKYNGNGFLQTAFTQNAQSLIAETDVDNRRETTGYDESTYAPEYACENTTDKIFLLSESEVINSDYGFAAYDSYGKENARIRFPTDYAKANYAYMDSTDGYGGYWWLRSPGYDISRYARHVIINGHADFSNHVHIDDIGVVPALSISF